jgi:choline-sulfatase
MASEFNRREFLGMSGATMMTGMLATGTASGLDPASTPGTGSLDKANNESSLGSSLAKRPNIVLFMPDEMRADSLACYGNPITQTPNIDRLAKEGAQFTNCHVQFPVCGASRCSMMTGWPTSVRGHRSLYYFLRPEEPNMFRYLRQAGYDVFWFGKNDALTAECFKDSVTEWAEVNPYTSMRGPMPIRELTPGISSMLFDPIGDRRSTGDYQHLQHAFKILERKEADKPFCIFLPLTQPHPPYTISQDFYNLYSPSSLPPLVPPGLRNRPAHHEGMRGLYGLGKLDDATFRKVRAVYYGQVSYSDWLLGELMEKLETTGHEKDTALFLFSDHGDYAGDFGLTEKWAGGLEDCLTHVPMIGLVPGGKAGVVASDMIELYDIMQTSLDLAGATANHTHFSRSLVPQINGRSGDPHRASFAEAGYNVYEPQCFEPSTVGGMYTAKIRLEGEQPLTVTRASMVRTRTHKLIVRPQGQSELYSYKEDPQEKNNLFGDRGAEAIQVKLQSKLLDHYINTTGIAPMDKDSRLCPPFYPMRSEPVPDNWQDKILDKE